MATTTSMRPSAQPAALDRRSRHAMSGRIGVPDLLVDTDVCIDHLEGVARLRRRHGRLGYSVITRCELLAGEAAHEPAVRRLLAGMDELEVDRRIADRAGLLRRTLAGLRTPDA